jgi:serine/threonine-protein kinase SRPK3
MDGVDITKAVFNKGKQMAGVATSTANGDGSKKRRKGTDLKPIVTNDQPGSMAEGGSASERYV